MAITTDDIEKWEQELRQGRHDVVQAHLSELTPRQIPRRHLAAVANMALRCGLSLKSLRWLGAVVDLSAKEKAIYGLSLKDIGCLDQAYDILSELDVKAAPEVLLFQAITLFAKWDYFEAIPLLEKYIGSSGLSEYQKLVGQLNLASALLTEDQETRAEELIGEILTKARQQQFQVICGNAQELLAQYYLFSRQHDKASQVLAAARELVKDSRSTYILFVEKLTVLNELLAHGPSSERLDRLNLVREQAVQLRHWATVRNCDLFKAAATSDIKLFNYVYFGTPWIHFRFRMLKLFPAQVIIPDAYEWQLGEGPSSSDLILDVAAGESRTTGARLKFGQLTHRLLQALAADFYAPVKAGALFARVFGDEYFNAETSLARLSNGLKRLQDWFDEAQLPLEIQHNDEGYWLSAQAPCTLLVQNPAASVSTEELFLNSVKSHFQDREFSMGELARAVPIPRRSLIRILNQAVDNGDIRRLGQASSARYQAA
jgi:hypothetical protein